MTENRGLSPRMGTLIFTLLVPIPMTGVIPWWITRWRFERPWFGLDWSRGVGACMIVAGAALLLSALAWFAHQGVKPYPPIKRLITTGPYAYTRNPMYTGVILILSGQSLLFARSRSTRCAFSPPSLSSSGRSTIRSSRGTSADPTKTICETFPGGFPAGRGRRRRPRLSGICRHAASVFIFVVGKSSRIPL